MANATKKQVEELTAEAKKTMEQNVEKMTKGIEEMTQFGQENVEAIVESSKIAAKAAEEMNAEVVAFSKKSYEDGVAAAKELTSCKSMTDFFEMQTSYAQSAFEDMVGQATRLNEMYSVAAKESLQPLNARFAAAVDVVKTYRA